MDALTLLLGLVIGAALGALSGLLWVRTRPAATEAIVDRAEVLQGLDRLSDQMRDLDHQRATWQGQLNQQVLDMRSSTETLRRETQSLSTALRKPAVRGRWGEMHLRRAVELAGMVDRCDFVEQAHTDTDDGVLRPDLVVQLVGERHVVVDSKVPLDAFLDATSSATDDEDQHGAHQAHQAHLAHLARHARQVRTHVDQLAGKRYWRALGHTPEFVVLFLPAESVLAAALGTDGGLIEYAAERHVVLATPTTLIALLRTVALGWSQVALADQAREIHRLGRDLHERLGTFSGHLDQVGRSLNAAVGSYNSAVGSLDARVLVAGRRFEALQVTDAQLDTPRHVDARARATGRPVLRTLDGSLDTALEGGLDGGFDVGTDVGLDRRAAPDTSDPPHSVAL